MRWNNVRKKKIKGPPSKVGYHYHASLSKKCDLKNISFWQRLSQKTKVPQKEGKPVKRWLSTKINHAKQAKRRANNNWW